jgi:hypothetical protein
MKPGAIGVAPSAMSFWLLSKSNSTSSPTVWSKLLRETLPPDVSTARTNRA